MTEEEAANQLIALTREYMKNPPEKRKVLYAEYQANRNRIKQELINSILEKRQIELDSKKVM